MERTVWNNRLIDGAKLDAISLNGSWKIDTTSLANWSVSDAELQTLNWITWNIQEQIDNINAWGWGWGWGWVILNPAWKIDTTSLADWSITDTELQALDWITWNIEVRLDNLEWTDLWDVALKSWTNTFTWSNVFNANTWFWKAVYWNPVSNASSATITVDCSQSNNQKITISENTTITFENLFQWTVFNFELNLTWVYTINYICKALPGNTIVPMYAEGWTKPTFTKSWVYHMTLKMSAVACHFMTSWEFLEFTN